MSGHSFESGLLAPRIVSNRRSLAAFLHAQDVLPSLPSEIHAAAPADATSRLVNTPQSPTRFSIEPRATNDHGAYVVLGYRAWDDTYRMRPVLETQRQQPPEPATGPRITNALTHTGRKAIDESARYLASVGRGFTTMLTLTLDNAARQRTAVHYVEGDYCTIGQRQVAEAEGDFSPLDMAADGPVCALPVSVGGACCPLGWVEREEVVTHARFTPVIQATRWVYGVQASGDFCDLATRQEWPHQVDFCEWPAPRNRKGQPEGTWAGPMLEKQQLLIAAPTAEGIHTLKPASSMQQEASRFFDGAQKIYQRGMDYQPAVTYSVRLGEETERWRIECVGMDGKPHIERLPGHATGYTPGDEVLAKFDEKKSRVRFERVGSMGRPSVPREIRDLVEPGTAFTIIKPKGEPLRYCWVAENPKNETGQDNPHMHINLSWLVPREAFEAWANRLEGIWGQGFAHLERLRDATAAGAYLLKAAGYLRKGEDGSQGWIIGNRYFVSREARAPKFQGVAVLPYEQFPLLLGRARDHQELKLAGLRMMRREARTAIKTATPAGKQKLIAKCKRWAKVLDGRTIIAGQWQLLLKGASALGRFLSWAGAFGHAEAEGVELPTKPDTLRWSTDWMQNAHTTTWHAKKTEDVRNMWEGLTGWTRRLKSMPGLLHDDEWEQLREFHDRFEPMPAYC